jgi:hypothetical protein
MVRPDLSDQDRPVSDAVRELVRGSVDLHVHAGPSLIPRRLTAIEAAEDARSAGQRGMVLKDHHSATTGVAALAKAAVGAEVEVVGSVVLNRHVGGLDPKVVETSLLAGAKVVWLPTVSAANHQDRVAHGARFPSTGSPEILEDVPITLLCGEKPTDSLDEILEVMREHADAILATGHASAAEVDVIIRTAADHGLQRLVVTHPSYLVGADLDDLRRWIRMGAHLEITGAVHYSGAHLFSVPLPRTVEMLHELDVARVLLSSDFGQIENPSPIRGLCSWFSELLAQGVDAATIRRASSVNPGELLLG